MNDCRCDSFVEFSFVSEVVGTLDEAEFARFVRNLWRDNLDAEITGLMRLRGRRLEVAIEGPGALILHRSARMMADARHGAIAVKAFGPIPARRAADWRVEGFEPPTVAATGAEAAASNLRHLRPVGQERPAADGRRAAALQ